MPILAQNITLLLHTALRVLLNMLVSDNKIFLLFPAFYLCGDFGKIPGILLDNISSFCLHISKLEQNS